MAVKKEDVLAYLESANMMEVSELISEIEEKFGVSAAAPVAVAAVPASVILTETSFPPTSVTLTALFGLSTPRSREWAASSPSELIIPICLTNLNAIIHS